ncbi:MAG: type II secretion system F family protein [Acidimicrobiales bacterium]
MSGLVVALCAAAGTYYLYTALVLGWRGLRLGPPPARATRNRRRASDWLVQAGIGDVAVRQFVLVTTALTGLGAVGGLALFGAALPALVLALCVGVAPLASYRVRRQQLRATAQEAWPRLIEEIRIRTSGLGRSVPQALFEAGERAPASLRPAFAAAQREWVLSTDFGRTVAVLKDGLADPTADAACETLLVAHEVGGSDLDRRLDALIEDRVVDVQGRKDARSKQAGVRFARRFVLLVPLGMALVGMSVGNGRSAYATPWGQTMVVIGIASVVACWVWAGRLLRLPEEQRVFFE